MTCCIRRKAFGRNLWASNCRFAHGGGGGQGCGFLDGRVCIVGGAWMGSRMARFLVGMICLQVGFLNGVLCWAQGFWQGYWVHKVGFLCSPRVPIQPRRHHPKAIPDRTARERTSPTRAQRSPGFTPRGPGLASRQYSPLKTRAMRVQKSGTHTLSQNGRFKVFTLSPTPTTLLMSKQLLHKQVNMYLPTIPVALVRQESSTCTTYKSGVQHVYSIIHYRVTTYPSHPSSSWHQQQQQKYHHHDPWISLVFLHNLFVSAASRIHRSRLRNPTYPPCS